MVKEINKTKRKRFDQEAIAKDIAADMLSLREIARKYGCSPPYVRKIKKKFNIERDLSPRVRQRIQTKLVVPEKEVPTEGVPTDDKAKEQFEQEAIEEAAKVGVEIITAHRTLILKCRDTAVAFLAELGKDEIVGKILDDGTKIMVPIPAGQKSTLFNSVTQALGRLVPLERQAYNLDEQQQDPDGKGKGSLTIFPSGPMTLSQWEKQVKEADEIRDNEKNNTIPGTD